MSEISCFVGGAIFGVVLALSVLIILTHVPVDEDDDFNPWGGRR